MFRTWIAQKSTRCYPLLFQTPRTKLPIQLSLACSLIFFPTLAFQFQVKNKSNLFLSLLRTVLTLLYKFSITETLSLTIWLVWCVHGDDTDNVFMVWNELAFGGNFRNRKVSPFCWTFKLTLFLNCEDFSLVLYVHSSVLDSLICWTLTLSETYQYCEHGFSVVERQWNRYRNLEI